ncbi:GNAT family N-acetyltransferase [Bacillus sp. Marseille-Q1617]|uniref:GNAT family N-acetyltransferase n=1 Tax=Bacillus sp. Marseille-Q1617 TaxID=2736887 RepID=UPI00158ED164|nr:GNAT family N-acetyltransferase [Bacillus sp. Marseille-Q1617]
MKEITFDDIYTVGEVIVENDLYSHVHYPKMLKRYDSNFLEFKRMPSTEEFKSAAKYLKSFHHERGQNHVKFSFPAIMEISGNLMGYLKHEGFDIGFMELYSIKPCEFPKKGLMKGVEVKEVKEDDFDKFISLQYVQDLEYGKEFADQKVELHQRQFKDPAIIQLLAYYNGEPAGAADVIINAGTAEIDGFFVLERWRRKGIGSCVQQYVMDRFHDKIIILVADGEDTPREMYQKQHYRYLGFQYQVLKVFEEN